MSTDYKTERDELINKQWDPQSIPADSHSKARVMAKDCAQWGFDKCLTESSVVRGLVEAIEWSVPKLHQAYHEGELTFCNKPVCVELKNSVEKYREALSEIRGEK